MLCPSLPYHSSSTPSHHHPLKGCGVFRSDINDGLFGPRSTRREPYAALVSAWEARSWVLLPLARLLVYPFALVFALLALPFTLAAAARRCASGPVRPGNRSVLKPPIQEEPAPGGV